jgi:ubiquinone/menaquinone biosynthesis C-methylase UbiE
VIFDTLARQFSRPSGSLGDAVAGFMNVFNAAMNARTLEAMKIEPRDHVLEIGFGGGPNLAPMAARAREGTVTGLDLSGDMVARARKRHRALVASGRLALHQGDVQDMPFRTGTFDSACSVNNVYFWPDPARALEEVRRVLKPGGTFVVTFRPRSALGPLRVLTPRGFRFYNPAEIGEMLGNAGFTEVETHRCRVWLDVFVCATARKPKARGKA